LAPGVQTDVFGNPVEGGDFAVVAPPKWDANHPDSHRAAFIDFDGFIVNPFADDKHQAAVMLFAEFRMSKEACRNEVLVEGNDAFFPGVYDDPEVLAQIRFPEALRLSAQNAVMEAFPPGSKHSIDILVEYFGKAVTGQMDAQAALDAAQKEIDEIYW
jgi:ABC-type glycerol-3-phosphate transport system substrate-binding protein